MTGKAYSNALECNLKYAHPTSRRKDKSEGHSLFMVMCLILPVGSVPPAMKLPYWKNVDRKLNLPMPTKNDV